MPGFTDYPPIHSPVYTPDSDTPDSDTATTTTIPIPDVPRLGISSDAVVNVSTIDLSKYIMLFTYDDSRETGAQALSAPSVLSENSQLTSRDWYLRRDGLTNAVVLQPHRSDLLGQNTDGFLMAHLPRLNSRERTYVSLLKFTKSDRWVRLVWNKGAQESYSVRDPVNPYLPSIMARRFDTIECRVAGGAARPTLKRGPEKDLDDSERRAVVLRREAERIWMEI